MGARLAERFLTRSQGFKDGDTRQDSSIYLNDHTAYVDVVGDQAQGAQPAFVVRGLNNVTNAPTDLFRVNKDGTISVSLNVNVQVGDLSSSYQAITARNLPGGYAGLDASLLLDPSWFGNLSASYQAISGRNVASGYAGLDASLFISSSQIGNLASSYQGIAGREAASGYAGLDGSLFISSTHIGDLTASYIGLVGKNAASGYMGLNGSVLMLKSQFYDGRTILADHFGFTTAGSSVANTAAQGSAWSAALAWLQLSGGRLGWGIGTYDNLPNMPMPNRSKFQGAGMQATVLRAKDNVNGSGFITNFVSPDGTIANAQFLEICGLTVDGNKAHQTSGAGIFWAVNPTGGFAAGNDDDFDSHCVLRDVWVINTKGEGVRAIGRSSNYYDNVQVYFADGIGIYPGFDTLIHACVTGAVGLQGFRFANSNMRVSACDAFYSGQITASLGIGFQIQSISGGMDFVGCSAQDNRAAAYVLDTCQGITISGCSADSNSTASAGLQPAVDMFNARNCHVEVNCMDRQWNGITNTQTRAVRLRSSSVNNRIRLTHWAIAGSVGQAIQQWDTDCTPNDVSISGCVPGYGVRNATFAAAFSLSPLDGNCVITTMTASMTLPAISANAQFPGQNLRYILKQGAGGFGITPNAVYHPNFASSVVTTASTYTIAEYQFDGTSYLETAFKSGVLA